MTFTPSNYQQAIFEQVQKGDRNIVVDALAGCLSGDTVIGVNRARKGSRMRLDHVVRMFNGGYAGGKRWTPEIPTFVRAPYTDGTVRLARLCGASCSGLRPLWEVTTSDGKVVRATYSHPFLTPDGWTNLCDLVPNVSSVLVDDTNGRQAIGRGISPKRSYLSRHVPYHPHAVNKGHGIKSVPTHRLNVEATMNNMDIEAYVWRLRTSADGLVFLDSTLEVHHKDNNNQNNGLNNLKVMTVEEHRREHIDDYLLNIQARLVPTIVVSVNPSGADETYDLEIENVHAFTANSIAVHNSGKTTTAVKAMEYIPENKGVCFLAFNKHIATELQARVPANARASTQHALGFSNLRKQFGRVKVEQYKVDEILDELMPKPTKYAPNDEKEQHYEIRQGVKKLVSLLKANLISPTNGEAIEMGMSVHDIELGAKEGEVLGLLPRIFEMITNCTEEIDFDDMLYLPVYHKVYPEKFDVLFIDEAQDFTPLQINFVLNSLKPGGMSVAIGDRFQSIYAFRFAALDAMDKFVELTNAVTLPLPITYRCPVSHVELAQKIVPGIMAREDAPEGIVNTIPEAEFFSKLRDGDMSICRVNAPLVPAAFTLIRMGIKATVRGRDIGKNLAEVARKVGKDAVDMTAMYNALEIFEKNETLRITHKKYYSESQLEALLDKVETLEYVMAECQTPGEVPMKIENLFSDDTSGIVLSSIHRCKGLEANRVFILRPDLIPHPMASKPWERDQEANLQYVSVTRSRAELYFVR